MTEEETIKALEELEQRVTKKLEEMKKEEKK